MRILEEDMRRAAEIQTGLLPGAPPDLAGYDVAASNRPCRAVGGDYYDFVVSGGQLLLALGDVAGKGTGAALLMMVLRAAVRAHWVDAPPAEATARINRTLCQNVPDNRFMTFVMARLDPPTGRLTYVNAGHNPPLLIWAEGLVEPLVEGGTVLGMFESADYAQGSQDLRPGDTLLVFSDGVTETWNDAGEDFGEERLAAVAVRAAGLDASSLQAEVLRELDLYAGSAKARDDRTLIVIRRL